MSEKLPSKKQHEVLDYIKEYIKNNGFSPTYREVMDGLKYKSVSTVAIHIDGLIACGLLVKRDNSARSLQIPSTNVEIMQKEEPAANHLAWLRGEIAKREASAELAEEAKVLKAAFALLDQTDE